MSMPVLTTKLFVPPPRSRAIQRPRLVERLQGGLRSESKLTLVSAPAGFGKSSLLSEWITDSRRRNPDLRVAWLSLEENDNEPSRFVSYLLATLSHAAPDVVAEEHNGQQPIISTLTSVINEIALTALDIVLILDDFQVIDAPSIRDAVAFLVDHLSANLHMVIASRSDPLLPIARLRARGELTELRAADLRFTPDEAESFLSQTMQLDLSPVDIEALEIRTEGWIAGLQLAALSMRDNNDISGFIKSFTGSHRFVIDYLAEEVLHRQSPHIRDFLVQTAVLERLSGSLCDSVTGRSDSAEILESLERDNLFVVPLDQDRHWYRYHHLFADVLRAELVGEGAESAAERHSLASSWFEANDLPEEAVQHALAAGDFDHAATILEAAIPAVRKSRQDSSILRWLTLLPEETVRRHPVLSVFSGWSKLTAGDVDAVEPWLAHAESLLTAHADEGSPAHDSAPGQELTTLPVTISLYRAAVAQAKGNLVDVRAHAQHALDIAAADDHLGRGAAAGLLGLASWASGDLEVGVAAFRVSRKSLELAGNLTDSLSTTMVDADMLRALGRLRESMTEYQNALHRVTENHIVGQPTADLHAGVSELFRDRNQLETAIEHLSASDALGEGSFSHEHRYRWFVSMSRVREAEGNPAAALEMLISAERLYLRGFFPEVRPIAGMRARVWITQGRLADAQAWLMEQPLSADDELDYLREYGHITLARYLLAQYASSHDPAALDDATALLDRLIDAATAAGRVGSVTEILVLQALALGLRDETSNALIPLERALVLAEPEGYVRLFLDEGAPMLALLRAAASAGIHPDFVTRLTRAFTVSGSAVGEALADPLSERELHVLRLLATSLTGPEIAREIYVSLNTMRTHTKHIFLKLDVSTRGAAVQRAEALGII